MSITEDKKLGKGLYWANGDIQLDDNGTLKVSEGRARTAQALQILLLTQLGEDLLHPATGMDFVGLAQSSSGLTPREAEDLAILTIQSAVYQDDRVELISNIELNSVETTGRRKVYDVTVTLFNSEELRMQLNVEV